MTRIYNTKEEKIWEQNLKVDFSCESMVESFESLGKKEKFSFEINKVW